MNKISMACLIMFTFLLGQTGITNTDVITPVYNEFVNEYNEQSFVEYDIPNIKSVPMSIPNINSSFKAYMDYRTITDKTSKQYQFISQHGWSDEQGFMRANADVGVGEDYYLIALGSYYGTEIGTKYRFTTDVGNVFYGVLADCKSNIHTDSKNQYTTVGTPNVVEFIVNTKSLNKNVKYHGSANVYAPLRGNIVKIERIEV